MNSTPYERYTMVDIAKRMSFEPNTTWFVVSRKWYEAWEAATAGKPNKAFAQITESTLGSVDNSDIVYAGTAELLPGLVDSYQIEVVPEESWNNLVQWYGQPSIILPRQVVAYPTASGLPETRLEIYQPEFWVLLLDSSSSESTPTKKVATSSLSSLAYFCQTLASAFRIPPETRYRVWNMPPVTSKSGIHLTSIERGTLLPVPPDENVLFTEFGRMGRVFAIEVCGPDGVWPLDAASVSVPEDPNQAVEYGEVVKGDLQLTGSFPGKVVAHPVPRGTMGLQNLGHTCFMNAGLQCLLHIPELERYFLENRHLQELNPSNPLGTSGKLAKAFGTVVHQVYPPAAKADLNHTNPKRRTGSSSSYVARDFHDTLCLYAPIFAGYEENDSQELIGFVLDSLHEDLNRVVKKPYVERPDWPDQDMTPKEKAEMEVQIAHETWEGYLRRNDSIVMDLFGGMYKSTVQCKSCQKVSVTFESFISLALPLPAPRWNHLVRYVPHDAQSAGHLVSISLSKQSSAGRLKKKIAKKLGTDEKRLMVAEVWKHRFFKFFDNEDDITELETNDELVVYELPTAPPDTLVLPLLHTCRGKPVGFPSLISVTRSGASSINELRLAVAEQARVTAAPEKEFEIYAFSSDSSQSTNKLETGYRLGVPGTHLRDLGAREAGPGEPLVKPTEALVCDWAMEAKHNLGLRWNIRSDLASDKPIEQGPVTIEDCLDEFTKTERLDWYCSRCGCHRRATKRLELWSTPVVLILQIKRFGRKNKIDDLVTFPIRDLDLSKRVTQGGHVYDLFAVDTHQGGNLSTGAYSTYAKNESDGGWYHYVDATVYQRKPEKAVNEGAYLLFYRRREP